MYLRTRGVGRNGSGRDGTGRDGTGAWALQRATGERWRMSVRRALRRSWEEEKGEERSSLACMQQTQHKRNRYISAPFLSFPFVSLVVMYFLSFSSPSNCRLSSNFLPGEIPLLPKMSQICRRSLCLMLWIASRSFCHLPLRCFDPLLFVQWYQKVSFGLL